MFVRFGLVTVERLALCARDATQLFILSIRTENFTAMVGKLNLAYVNFFKEARGKRVVKISKIVNFAPKTHADFSDDAIYDVKWPHFPSEGSFSEEGNFPAKILCLGGKKKYCYQYISLGSLT